MIQFSRAGRLAAALIAVAGWTGLALYVAAEAGTQKGDWLGAVWTNLGFLTDLTNLLLAVVMTGVAFGVRPLSRPHAVGWAVAAIATVGVGYWLIGGRLVIGTSALEDMLLHGVTPWASLLWWAVFAPKGELRWARVFVWLAWPVGYFVYALSRGALTGDYAYGFLDPAKSNLASTAATIGMIVVLFGLWGAVLLGLDRVMRPRRPAVEP